jgi:hypothetical protein
MRRIPNIALMMGMALMLSSSSLSAQCGSSVKGSTVYCCGTAVYVSDEWMPGGGSKMQTLVNCAYAVNNCQEYIVFADGNCAIASLSTPEIRKQLDQISQQMPLLIASCTSGLVPYQPHLAEVSGHKELTLRTPKLDLTWKSSE